LGAAVAQLKIGEKINENLARYYISPGKLKKTQIVPLYTTQGKTVENAKPCKNITART
jgi:hypothetical protein